MGRMAFIYIITNQINGKQYVGKTTRTIYQRFNEHIYASKMKKYNMQYPLYKAIKKYGIENFSIKQLEECPVEKATDKEKYWIEKFNTYNNGYNATLGGEGLHHYNYKIIAEKYQELQNQRETAQFFDCDIDTVRKACLEHKVKIKSSVESLREKCSKKIQKIDSKNNQVLFVYNSIADAARALVKQGKASDISISGVRSHISAVCKNKRKTAYGYKWKYY